jgi:hypothetical protein
MHNAPLDATTFICAAATRGSFAKVNEPALYNLKKQLLHSNIIALGRSVTQTPQSGGLQNLCL